MLCRWPENPRSRPVLFSHIRPIRPIDPIPSPAGATFRLFASFSFRARTVKSLRAGNQIALKWTENSLKKRFNSVSEEPVGFQNTSLYV